MDPKPWNLARKKGIWDPKPKVIKITGTNLKSLTVAARKELRGTIQAMAFCWGLQGLHWGYIMVGIMQKKMETTIVGYIGVIIAGYLHSSL